VFGTTKPLLKTHSNSAGFDPAFAPILIEATAITDTPSGGFGYDQSPSWSAVWPTSIS
jgi:hypothetical protein